jgi:hypothetical protein
LLGFSFFRAKYPALRLILLREDPPRNDRFHRVPFPICTQRLVTAIANLHAHKAGREDSIKFHTVVIEPHVYLSEATWDVSGCAVIDDTIECKIMLGLNFVSVFIKRRRKRDNGWW